MWSSVWPPRLADPAISPIQKLRRFGLDSCGCSDVDLEAEALDATDQLFRDARGVAAGEVVGAEFLVASAVGEHVVGGREDRGRKGDRCFLGPAARLEAQELGPEIAVANSLPPGISCHGRGSHIEADLGHQDLH